MSEPFDPYRKWLGIQPKDSAGGPNHYRLLGIATFENDPDVIENAASRQMAHVRTFKNSKHAPLSQRILTELSAAKLCLLTPEHKSAYDEQLRTQLAAAGKLSDSMAGGMSPELDLPPLPAASDRWRTDEESEPESLGPPPVPIPMPVGTAVAPLPVIRRGSAISLRARRKNSALPLAVTLVSLVLLVGLAGIAALVFGGVLGDAGRSNNTGSSNTGSKRHNKPAEKSSEKPNAKSVDRPFDKSQQQDQPQAGTFPFPIDVPPDTSGVPLPND